jgi:hypothetical protein
MKPVAFGRSSIDRRLIVATRSALHGGRCPAVYGDRRKVGKVLGKIKHCQANSFDGFLGCLAGSSLL